VRRPAYFAASLILCLGLFALVAPAHFIGLVSAMQPPPKLYVIAAIRVGMGVSFLFAAEGSRARLAVAFLGFVLVAGGLVTPFIGQGIARWIVDAAPPEGGAVVRGWGIAALILGAFTFWALQPHRPKRDADIGARRGAP
jgi:hypothetical protein